MLENEEFIPSFVEEARAHLETLEAGLLMMDTANVDPEVINNVFRAVHSIKGTAGFFNMGKIVELSHSMENVLGECRKGLLKINSEVVDRLLSAGDCLKAMVNDVMNSENMDISEQQKSLKAILESKPEGEMSEAAEPRTGSVIIGDGCGERLELTEEERRLILNETRYGKRLYRISAKINEGPGNAGPGTYGFLKLVKSVGTLVRCHADVHDAGGEDEDTGDIFLDCLLLSVLEADLLSDAIGIPADKIFEPGITPERETPTGDSGDTIASGDISRESEVQKNHEPVYGTAAKISKCSGSEDSIRVRVTLLNSLLNLASEMVLGRNQLLRTAEPYRKSMPGIEPVLQNVDRVTSELQETIMQTRMQPLANVFNKFPRIIRDISRKLGKDIRLRLEGEDVELDKSIIESLEDPLTHLVRNAADHGLEPPDEREAAGKPRTGEIVLKAYHEGGYVNIDIIDDGKGIDIEKVKNKALGSGLMDKNEFDAMNDQEALQLLFRPGFSTADRITDLSGRGVGMDVVKTNIEKLGGIIEVFTGAGRGTTFRLLLPLTLAIIPSLIVEVENQKFAIPQINLQEIVRIKPGDISRKIEYVNDSEVLRLREKLLPIVHLADVLGIKRTYIDPETGERKEERRRTFYDRRRKDACITAGPYGFDGVLQCNRKSDANTLRILVIKIGSRRFGLAVDIIHESEEILVKPLPGYINECKCYSGVTIMGDGKITMILDLEGIVQKAGLKFAEDADSRTGKASSVSAESTGEQLDMLIFKCSGPEIFGVDMSLVSRVETIKPEDIEKIGDREYIKFRGSSLRVIRPEDFLPVNSRASEKAVMFVIIPKFVRHPMGIIAESILDTVQTGIQLDEESIKAKGLFGSFIHNDRIILLLNIYELFELADPEHYEIKYDRKEEEKRSILLVEDTPFFLKLESSWLEAAGYTVVTACNGKEAMQVLEDNDIDVVVSDINMPEIDGLELVRRIRADKRLSDLPVIAVTSLTGDKHVKAGIEAGFDFYEYKLDRPGLLQKIELAIQKRRGAV